MPIEGRGLLRDALRAAIHLVCEQPRALTLDDRRDVEDVSRTQDLTGRVVRVADADDLRALGDRGAQRIEIETPAPFLAEPDLLDLRAEAARDAVELHVVRHDDDDLIARIDERGEREEVRLARAGRDEHVVARRVGVEPGDERAGLVAAHPVGVAEALAAERVEVPHRILEGQRFEARLGEVVLHPVLPGGLHALHVEGGELHRHSVQSGISASRRQRVAAPPASGRTRRWRSPA